MAITITAYQQIGAPEVREVGVVERTWNPSNDMVRDNDRENNCLLLWKIEPLGARNLRINVFLNPDGEQTESIPVTGVARSVSTVFRSSRASLGNNNITYDVVPDGDDHSGAVRISDDVVFYKRLVEGV